VAGVGPNANAPDTRFVQEVSGNNARSETYIDITAKGRKLQCLLDTGCERSVCRQRLCRNAKIVPVDTELFAANGTRIPVIGATRIFFEVSGMSMYADVLVSDAVDELIIGFDWLTHNNCEWLFGLRRIIINGVSIQLRTRASRPSVRRIFVRESVSVPADTSVDVPVRMPFVNLQTPLADWLSESKEVRPGLLVARTLLADDDRYAAIRFINVSRVTQLVKEGHALGLATPCVADHTIIRKVEPELTSPSAENQAEGDRGVVDPSSNNCAPNDPCEDSLNVRAVDVNEPAEPGDNCSQVQPVIDRLPESLTEDQRRQAVALIKRNTDVFSRFEFDVGCATDLTARIETGNHPPIAEPLRRQARAHLDVIDETIDRMKAAGIVEDCCSPWSANLVVVARKDDQGNPITPPITIDFRGLNSITTKDKFPLPRVQDCLQMLDRAAYLSVFDLSNSFFQVPIHPGDRDKTAFRTRRGQFRLTRLAQGCTNSPAVFCRLMSLVLRGLTCALAFIDDTLVFSPSFECHLADLEAVLNRFRKANLKLKPTKCRFFRTSEIRRTLCVRPGH